MDHAPAAAADCEGPAPEGGDPVEDLRDGEDLFDDLDDGPDEENVEDELGDATVGDVVDEAHRSFNAARKHLRATAIGGATSAAADVPPDPVGTVQGGQAKAMTVSVVSVLDAICRLISCDKMMHPFDALWLPNWLSP
jgi:hypothetical protein